MAKLIKLPTSALYVPENTLSTFKSRFKCSPYKLGTIRLTVSDEAYSAVQTALTTDMECAYSLEYGDSSDVFDPIIPRGLIRVRHNIPGRFDVIRAILSRSFEEPRIDLLTYNEHTSWWLCYHLKRAISTSMCEVPGVRFKVMQ